MIRDSQQQYQAVPMHQSIYSLASMLILTYATQGLRAYDAIQLACALFASRKSAQDPLTFVSGDTILLSVAQQAGLQIQSPL